MPKPVVLATKLPVALSDVKAHLRVETTDEDDLITSYIQAAVGVVEKRLHRHLVVTHHHGERDRFPPDPADSTYYPPHLAPHERNYVFLDDAPVREIVKIEYLDGNGDWTTLDASLYMADLASEPARIAPAWGESWPATRLLPNSVKVHYNAGYLDPFTADSSTDVITATIPYSNGETVRFTNNGGALPSPLTQLTDYYVVNASDTTFQIALTSGGPAIDLTDAGSGDNFVGEIPTQITQAIKLLVGHWYWNREAAGPPLSEVPLAFDALLDSARWTL